MLIGIDPGHGGKDPGAVNKTLGLQEKTVTLQIAKKLDSLLKYNNVDTVMTRTADKFVSLKDRVKLLNDARVNYVLSIHINSFTTGKPHYISTYIVARGGKAEQLAKKIQQKLVAAVNWPDGGVRVSNFYMVRETRAPAVLVELGFISHLETAKQLQQTAIQRRLAVALARGIAAQLGIPFTQPETTFTDIQGHWAEEEINWAVEQELFKGVAEDRFAPDEPVTRAQLALVLKRFYDKLQN